MEQNVDDIQKSFEDSNDSNEPTTVPNPQRTEKISIKGKEEVIIEINGIWVYRNHRCKCGCEKNIIYKKSHKYQHIPIHIQGHNCKINNPMSGKKQSEETKIKRSFTFKNMGENHPSKRQEVKDKIRKKAIENWKNPEHYKKHSDSMKGKFHKVLEETKEKIRKNMKGKKNRLGTTQTEDWKNKKREWCKSKGIKPKITPESIKKRLKSMEGYTHSQETRNKISIGNKGKTKSEEHKKKLLENSPFKKGEKHIFFNNWSSRLPYPQEWDKNLKRHIAERDNFICQYCGKHIHTFEKRSGCPHHIDYDKKNCNPNNLIWVCHKCNLKFNSPNKREYFKNLFQNKINEKVKTWEKQKKLLEDVHSVEKLEQIAQI